MKLLNFAIIALLTTTFIACNKDESNPAPAPSNNNVEGVFIGKYGFDNETPDKNWTLKFTGNGTVQEIGQSSGNATGQGTYTLSGNHLSASYTMLFAPYNDYYIDATYDAANKTITGTWGYTPGGTDGGKFSLKK
jgi:hypothetical protein